VHLRGTLTPETATELARKHKVSLPSAMLSKMGSYNWGDFEDFLNVYNFVGRVIREPEDLSRVTEEYLRRSAAEGTIYVEFMLSPTHSEQNGIPLNEQLEAVSHGIASARSAFDIEAKLIITCVRHSGPDVAIELIEDVVRQAHPDVVGFGLTGDERRFHIDEFAGAFLVAREAGLGLTAHTGEWLDAKSALNSVNSLNLSRVGHGIRAIEDNRVLNELAEREIGFEVCLSSNIQLMACPSLIQHPLSRLINAGCKVTLSTDDPAYFQTFPVKEYLIARDQLGISCAILNNINRDSVNMVFCDSTTKKKLMRRLGGA
jgi:adenosine deaminase